MVCDTSRLSNECPRPISRTVLCRPRFTSTYTACPKPWLVCPDSQDGYLLRPVEVNPLVCMRGGSAMAVAKAFPKRFHP
jgi:hypothetical protein